MRRHYVITCLAFMVLLTCERLTYRITQVLSRSLLDWSGSFHGLATDKEGDDVSCRARGPLEAEDPSLLRFLKEHHLDPPSPLPYNLSSDEKYLKEAHHYTYPFIHMSLKKIFEGQLKGFFVEAGAMDGEFLSNTLYLEKDLGWDGLLVEPDSTNYRHLLYKHRKAWSSNTCLSGSPFARETTFQSYQRVGEQMSVWLYRANTHEIDQSAMVGSTMHALSSKSYSKVQCFPLASYLSLLNVSTVDFFSLDVQGAEVGILEAFPWDTVTLRVLVVEHYATGKPQGALDYPFIDFLTKKGFRLLGAVGEPDYFFVLKTDSAWERLGNVLYGGRR
ncbi:protein Star-like [Oratosquilla oratoria]|uniref:protein Star-like n=1 Tax=Oratosquilla oratoria TaxID=337810 RepID=UPI003F757406